MAYWTKCAPCHLHYDVIGKMETSEEDVRYIAAKTGMPRQRQRLHLQRRQAIQQVFQRWSYSHYRYLCISDVD